MEDEANRIAYQKIEKIYSETREFFEKNQHLPYIKPISQSGKIGFCILYTPPIFNPDVLIIGQNPSYFTPKMPRSEIDKIMMSGEIPRVNSYIEHNHIFAKEIRRIFKYDKSTFLENCVGTNIWFFNRLKLKMKIYN